MTFRYRTKWIFIFLASFFMLLFITACKSNQDYTNLKDYSEEAESLAQNQDNNDTSDSADDLSNPALPVVDFIDTEKDYSILSFSANYPEIQLNGYPQIQLCINTEIEHRIQNYLNEMYTNTAINAFNESDQGDASNTNTSQDAHVQPEIRIEGIVMYQDNDLISISFNESPENFTYQRGKFLNFDFSTGQVIPFLSLVTKDDLLKAIDDATANIDSFFLNAYDFENWQMNDDYYFIDSKHIQLVVPPYQLSSQISEPMTLSFEIGQYTTPDSLAPVSLSYNFSTLLRSNDMFQIDYNYPVFSTDTVAIKKINSLIKTDIDEAINYNIDMAIDDHNSQEDSTFILRPYYFTADYEIYTNSDNILSLGIHYYQFTGGAHGLMYTIPYTYNISTGNPIHLSDLFPANYDYESYINTQLIADLDAKDSEYDWYQFEGINDDTKFYIASGKLIIYFDVYEIAPYAAGIQSFEITLPNM